MVALSGPLATESREPGQAWKGAAAAVDSCAGVWLVRAATQMLNIAAPALHREAAPRPLQGAR